MEVEKLTNNHTMLFLTETQQKLDTTIWNSSSRGVVANARRVKVRFSLRAIILSLENLNVIIRAIN